jgi:hypothetical protein
MSLRSPIKNENGGIPSHGPFLDSSFPRTRESSFAAHPISLDTRFRGYEVIQATSPGCSQVFSKQSLVSRHSRPVTYAQV